MYTRAKRKQKTFEVLTVVAALLMCLVASEIGLRLYGLTDPVIYRADPEFGYEPVPRQTVRQRWVEPVFDDRGFRVVGPEKDSRTGRLIFLGGSITYGGTRIATEDTFVGILDRHLAGTDWRAYNGAVNSYSMAQMAHRYMRSLHREQDGMVVVFFAEPDWTRPPVKFVINGGPFYNRKPACALVEAAHLFSLLKFGRPLRECGFRIPGDVTRGDELTGRVADITLPHFFGVNREAMLKLVAFCRDKDIPLSLVHWPRRDFTELDERITRFISEESLPLFDISPHLREVDLDSIYMDVCHMTPEGHRVVGELLWKHLDTWAPGLNPE